jgi:predicted dehydrogenase
MKFTVAIIGLGNIGMGYDQNLSPEDFVLTHARAFHLHSGFQLIAGVDPVEEKRQAFLESYHAEAYPNVDQLVMAEKPDVIVVANPTKDHYATVQTILSCYKPLVILCEKPLGLTQESSQGTLDICREKSTSLYVNFIRRADSGIQEVKKRIDQQMIKPPYKAVVWYSKGIFHNGLHFIDLLTYWFGKICSFSIIDRGELLSEHDAEPDVRFQFERASALFCAASEKNFSHYTVEVIAANGRLRLEKDGTLHWQDAVEHPTLLGYRQLQSSLEVIPNSMSHYQLNMAEELYKVLTGAENSLCTGEQALETQKWVGELVSIAQNNGQ